MKHIYLISGPTDKYPKKVSKAEFNQEIELNKELGHPYTVKHDKSLSGSTRHWIRNK